MRSTSGDEDQTQQGRRVEVACENGQWQIRESPAGTKGPERAYPAREKAVAQARALAEERGAVLVIYDEEGTIEEQQDYGTMGARPRADADATGPAGIDATARAAERSMHRG